MPFRFNVTGSLKNGDNELRIEVANAWANRIIGDAITGENAIKGQVRFDEDVIRKSPDVILIDYALNDRSAGLERAKEAWEK